MHNITTSNKARPIKTSEIRNDLEGSPGYNAHRSHCENNNVDKVCSIVKRFRNDSSKYV